MYGYIYLITNKINGKIYIGQHKYDKAELDTTYHGSGTILKRAYDKYGIDNFTISLIDTAETLEELNIKEIFYIDSLDCKNPEIGYNIAIGGGKIGLCGESNGMYGKHHTAETIHKMSECKKGDKHPCYGRTGDKHPMYGKHHSDESKEKIGLKARGRRFTDEHKQKLSNSHKRGKHYNAKIIYFDNKQFACIKDAYDYAIANGLYNRTLRTFYGYIKENNL